MRLKLVRPGSRNRTGSTALPRYDAADGNIRIRVSAWHLGVLVVAKLLDTATTALALWLAPDRLAEAQPLTALAIARLGVLEGTLLVGWLAVVAIAALAELAGGVLEAVRRRLGVGSARLSYSVTAFTYYVAAAWFGLLAVSNLWVLATALGVIG